jgi:succinate dehydrogenase / fumarate reductase cytochrome b subunit
MTLPSPATRFATSSIGKKLVVALTGLVMVLFLVGHLSGNLLMYAGPDATNAYGEFLKGFMHGWGIWIARVGLLVALALHVAATVKLTTENRAARASRYAFPATVQASWSSRLMLVSGLTVLAFVGYHLAHFTWRIGNAYGSYRDAAGRHDIYRMVVEGFSWWPATLFYVLGMTLLCSHLGHGVASVFQTLGLANDRNWPLIKRAGNALALALYLGFISIPFSVALGLLH